MPTNTATTGTTGTWTTRSRGAWRILWWGLAVVAIAVHLAALYWPTVTVEGPVSWSDKVMHVALFALPTYAVGLALRRIAPVALAFAVHAPVSELVQHLVLPHRSGDVWDALMDLAGVGLGVLALWAHRAVVVGRARARW